MDNSVVEKIIKEIEQYKPAHEGAHAGKVVSVGDGVVAIDGSFEGCHERDFDIRRNERQKVDGGDGRAWRIVRTRAQP